MSLSRARKWEIVAFTSSGSNTLISGAANQRLFIKRYQFMVDSATDLYFCDSDGRQLTNTFFLPHIGGASDMDQLDILVAVAKDFCINSTSAVTGSIMIDYQRVAV